MTQLALRCGIYGCSGYVNTNLLYIKGLLELGVNLKIVDQPIEYLYTIENADTREMLKKAIDTPLEDDFIYLNRTILPEFKPWHGAKKTFASTVWETSSYPEQWLNLINNSADINTIIVPSHFNRDILENDINKPVVIVREGIDFSLIKPKVLKDSNTFNFFSLFQWLPRKSYDILLEAFFREFDNNDDVSLTIKTSSLNYEILPSSAILTYIVSVKNKYKRTYPVYVNTTSLPYEKIADLFSNADAFISPSRCEGYNRVVLEAMANELPVIATNWSGQTEFITNENSYLLEYQLRPVESQWYSGDFQSYMEWAEPSIDHLQYLLRHVYNNREEAKSKAKQAKQDSLKFDYLQIAQNLKDVLGI